MTLLSLYLITTLPRVGLFLGAIATFIIIGTCLVLIFSSAAADYSIEGESREAARRIRSKVIGSYKLITFLVFFFGFASVLTPSERQIYQIVGAYAVTSIDGIDKLPSNLVGVANKYLEELAGSNKKKGD